VAVSERYATRIRRCVLQSGPGDQAGYGTIAVVDLGDGSLTEATAESLADVMTPGS